MIEGMGRGLVLRMPGPAYEATPRGPTAVEPAATAGKPQSAKTAAGQMARKTPAADLVRTMAASPPVNTAKVDVLRTAIAAGTYKPDPVAIAAKMIALDSGGKR